MPEFNKDKVKKLPKQWKHWCLLAGLKPDGPANKYSRQHYRLFNLIGKNRHWRVNCNGEFEASCPKEHFDRWANSRGALVETVPRTKQEFLAVVKLLWEQSKDAR